MKLFAVHYYGGRHYETMHVHADNAAEAYKVAREAEPRAMHGTVTVWDLSQQALCAGVLKLKTCPVEIYTPHD